MPGADIDLTYEEARATTTPDRLAAFRERRARVPGQFDSQLAADADWLAGEVERLQQYEVMWQDCRRHCDQAEKRARHYLEIMQQVAELVDPMVEDEAL